MMKFVLVIAGILAGLSVVLGAFAAHGLKNHLDENWLNAFQTGVHYQMLHALALILICLLARTLPHSMWNWSAGFMMAGILCFSGSLYALALTGIKWFGPITPLGGLFFIVGWVLFTIAAAQSFDCA